MYTTCHASIKPYTVYISWLLQIMDGLRFSIHKQYNEFMKRNPHFNGTVNVFAHSLGSVLMYDLLLETCDEMGVDHSDIEPNSG